MYEDNYKIPMEIVGYFQIFAIALFRFGCHPFILQSFITALIYRLQV